MWAMMTLGIGLLVSHCPAGSLDCLLLVERGAPAVCQFSFPSTAIRMLCLSAGACGVGLTSLLSKLWQARRRSSAHVMLSSGKERALLHRSPFLHKQWMMPSDHCDVHFIPD